MNKRHITIQRLLWAMLILLGAATLAACSAGTVKGESPFVQVSSWRIDDTTLSLELRLRNVNDETLALSRVDLQVTVDDAVPLVSMRKSIDISIPGGGFETLALQATMTDTGGAFLDSLASEQRASLAFRLQGSVDSEDEGNLQFQHSGHIYPVPGRPGEFR